MKLHRLAGAIGAAILLALVPARAAEQASYVTPEAGPMSMATFTGTYLNPALRALASCSWGTTAPTNGPSSAALPYQCWADTTANPVVFKFYDGTQWVTAGKLNTSTHAWTPSYQGTDLGTASIAATGTSGHAVPFLDGNNTWSGTALFTASLGFTNNQNASTSAVVTNTDLGVSAAAGYVATNSNASASFSLGGANNSAAGLTNRAFIYAQTALDGISIYNQGADPIDFYVNGTRVGGFTSAGLWSLVTPQAITEGGTGANSASGARTALGLAIGSDVQAFDSDLAALASNSTNGLWTRTGAGTGAARTIAGTSNEVCVTNGDGVSGNPTLGICSGWLSTAHTWSGQQTFAAPISTGIADNQGTLKLSAFVTSTQITANQNNYTATDGGNTCSGKLTLRISSDASRNITGLSCGQAEGDVRVVHNVGSFSIVLTNQDANSTAANRFLFGGGDVTLAADTSIAIRYDGVASRWRAITTPGAGGGGGGVTSITAGAGLSGGTITTSGTITPLFESGSLTNCTLAASVSSNALTVALKTQAGSDPSSGSPCVVSFRNATAATGYYTAVSVTAATSFSTGTSGSTFGSANNVPFRLWVTAFNNAGTVVLGISKQSSSTAIFPLNEEAVQSSTACSACTNATTAGVFYTAAAQTSKAIRILGYLEWSSGLTTAGTWASGPTKIQLMGPGVRKPGATVQMVAAQYSTNTSTTNTTPTATGQSVSISPTSAVNMIHVAVFGPLGQTTASKAGHIQIARGGTGIGGTTSVYSAGGTIQNGIAIFGIDLPGTTSSTAYSTMFWTDSGGTVAYVGGAGDVSIMQVTEIQG